jgi:hypothetical protein
MDLFSLPAPNVQPLLKQPLPSANVVADYRFVAHRSPIERALLVLPAHKRSNLNRGNLEAPPGFEPGMEICRQGQVVDVVTRLAFWLALPSPLTRYSGAICSHTVPRIAKIATNSRVQIIGSQPLMPTALYSLAGGMTC